MLANPPTLRGKPAYRIIYKGTSGSILKGLRRAGVKLVTGEISAP